MLRQVSSDDREMTTASIFDNSTDADADYANDRYDDIDDTHVTASQSPPRRPSMSSTGKTHSHSISMTTTLPMIDQSKLRNLKSRARSRLSSLRVTSAFKADTDTTAATDIHSHSDSVSSDAFTPYTRKISSILSRRSDGGHEYAYETRTPSSASVAVLKRASSYARTVTCPTGSANDSHSGRVSQSPTFSPPSGRSSISSRSLSPLDSPATHDSSPSPVTRSVRSSLSSTTANNSPLSSMKEETEDRFTLPRASTMLKKIVRQSSVRRTRAASAVTVEEECSDSERDDDERYQTAPTKQFRQSSHSIVNNHREPVAGGSLEDAIYTPSCDLLPSTSLHEDIKQITKSFDKADWQTKFDTLTLIRRLAIWHSDALAPNVRILIKTLREEVDSLRSQLSKNALMACCDLFENLPTQMETELPSLIPLLLKRQGDVSGAFLAEESARAIECMIVHCTMAKVLTSLLNSSTTGTKIVKTQALVALAKCVDVHGSAVLIVKESSRLLKTLGLGCGDASALVRQVTRDSVTKLVSESGSLSLEKQFSELLTPAQFDAMKKVIEKAHSVGERSLAARSSFSSTMPAASSTVKHARRNTVAAVKPKRASTEKLKQLDFDATTIEDTNSGRAKSKNTEEIKEEDCEAPAGQVKKRTALRKPLRQRSTSQAQSQPKATNTSTSLAPEYIPDMLASLGNTDWKQRLAGINALAELARQHPNHLSLQFSSIFDSLSAILGDKHGKVIVAVLESMTVILPVLVSESISHTSLFVLLTLIAKNLAASNVTVRSLASELFDQLPVWLAHQRFILVQPYSQMCLFESIKIRSLMVEKLTDLIGNKSHTRVLAGSMQSAVVAALKPALPVAFAWLTETKTDTKICLQRLTAALYGLLGSDMFDSSVLVAYKISAGQAKQLKQAMKIDQ